MPPPLKKESRTDALLEFSARLGGNPLLVQAGTGNTSIKLNGVLWIKASGKWLCRARQEPILVPVDLCEAQRCVERNIDIAAVCQGRFGELRPSIETAMHAVLPYRVIVHVHSVNTIAWAVRRDACPRLAARLSGLDWRWIPYVSSGVPLAREIENCLAGRPATAVFVLGNHGLVIGADCCEDAEALLQEVEQRLRLEARPWRPGHAIAASAIACDSQWRLPDIPEIHVLGTDPISRRILSEGILYPCQAIFLGAGPAPAFRIVEDRGVLVQANLTRAQSEMLKGLMHVVQRVDPSAPIRYLSETELAGVLDKEARQYRTAVERNGDRWIAD